MIGPFKRRNKRKIYLKLKKSNKELFYRHVAFQLTLYTFSENFNFQREARKTDEKKNFKT